MSSSLKPWLYKFEVRMATVFLRVFCFGVLWMIAMRIYHHEHWNPIVLILAIAGSLAGMTAGYYQYKWEHRK